MAFMERVAQTSNWLSRNASWIVALTVACTGGLLTWGVTLAQVTEKVEALDRQLIEVRRDLRDVSTAPPAKMAEATREALESLKSGQKTMSDDIRELRTAVMQLVAKREK